MAFTAVFLPEFPIVAWTRDDPELATRPHLLVEGVPPQERVFALCVRAAALGVEHGMSRAQAEAGTAAVVRPRNQEQEQAAFAVLVAITRRFTPHLEVVASPANHYAASDGPAALLLLDSTGTHTLFGTSQHYAQALHSALQRDGFPAHIGAAPNAQVALMLARHAQGIACADKASTPGILAHLPVSLLPGDPKTLALLRRWGIRTLGELARLPRAALVSRLGQHAYRLQQLACGEAERLFVPEPPEFVLSETTNVDHPLEQLDALLHALSPMLEQLLHQALEFAYALRFVTVVLRLERGASHILEVRPATPTQSYDLLLKLLHLELEARPPGGGIVGITLTAEPTEPQTAQRGLFQTQFPEPDKLALLLARLRSIAGDNNVGAPQLQNSHDEMAFHIDAFHPRLSPGTPEMSGIAHLALRAFRPPQPARVTCWESQPRALFWGGTRFAVAGCAGPWHASGSWWNGQAGGHDFWDVVTVDPSQALRLRQDHATQSWSVVGLYD